MLIEQEIGNNGRSNDLCVAREVDGLIFNYFAA